MERNDHMGKHFVGKHKIAAVCILGILICAGIGLGLLFFKDRTQKADTSEQTGQTGSAEDVLEDDSLKTIEYVYKPFIKDFRSTETLSFEYSDKLLADKNATKISPKLAKASAALSAGAYILDYLKQMIEDMGYDILSVSYDNDMDYKDNDKASYVIARKLCSYTSAKKTAIYLITIKGTSGDYEWFSNLKIGTSGDHEGFFNTAENIKKDVMDIVQEDADKCGVKKDDIILWFTGHSRGGAVANVIAGKIDDEKLLPMDNVFCYCFATPVVSRNLTKDQEYDNIYNYILNGDLIPSLGEPVWNYHRYGHEIRTLDDEMAKFINNTFLDRYGVSWQPLSDARLYTSLLTYMVGSEERYNSRYAELIRSIIAGVMSRRFMDSREMKEFMENLYEEYGELLTEQAYEDLMKVLKNIRTAYDRIRIMADYADSVWTVLSVSGRYIMSQPGEKVKLAGIAVKLLMFKSVISELTDFKDEDEDIVIFSVFPGMTALIHGHSPASYIIWMDALYQA